MDARVKLVFVLLYILSIVLTSPGSWTAFVVYLAIIAIPVLFSKLPLVFLVKRSLAVIPFVLAISIFLPFVKPGEIIASYNLGSWQIDITREGVISLVTILIKAWLSLVGLIWLTSTTRITDLLQSSKRLGFPQVLVTILSFMYRYIFVIFEELTRMKRARDSRSSKRGGLRELRTAGNLIGTLFIRSYERSERVYAAMIARGYDGQSRALKYPRLRTVDLITAASLLVILISAAVFNILGWI